MLPATIEVTPDQSQFPFLVSAVPPSQSWGLAQPHQALGLSGDGTSGVQSQETSLKEGKLLSVMFSCCSKFHFPFE